MQNKIKRILETDKIAMLTAYDYSMASLLAQNNLDIILVDNSANSILNGEKSSLEDLTIFTKRVSKGVKDNGNYPLIVAELSNYKTIEEGLILAIDQYKAGAQAIKIKDKIETEFIQKSLELGIPVMGQISYTHKKKDFLKDLELLEKAGVFSIVLECIPWQISKLLTKKSNVPTIGIGSGPYTKGQLLVGYDLLGLTPTKPPKFVWQYNKPPKEAIRQYVWDVKSQTHPLIKESYSLDDPSILEQLL